MQVHTGSDTACGRGHQVADVGFHGHDRQALGVEQLLLGHPGQVAIGRIVASFLAPLRIRLDDADDFVLVGQFAEGGHLGGGMIVSDANLAHLDPLPGLTSGGRVRLQPGCRHGQGTCTMALVRKCRRS